KPANIMVGDYGEVFIADWGLALYRAQDDTSHAAGKISLGHLPEEKKKEDGTPRVSGTPAFMAPEQILNKADDLDSQIDVYALGTILYSILTWEPSPFEGASTVTELMQNVASHKFLRPRRRAPKRKIPYELEAITLKAMHENKARRYESVIALLADVRNYLAKYPVSAYSPLPHYRLYKLIRRRPLVPVTLLAALLTLGAWNLTLKFHNYIDAQSLLVMVDNLLEECEKSRNLAHNSRNKLNDAFASTGNTEIHGSNLRLKSHYLRNSNEFAVSCNRAWDMLTKLLNLNVDRKLAAKHIARLLNNQVMFANAVDNQPLLNQTFERLNNLPADIKALLYERNPSLVKQVKMFARNSGELKINTNISGIKLSAVKVSDGHSAGNHPKAAADTFVEIKPSPEVNQLHAGQYMITAHLPDNREIRFPIFIERDKLEEMDFMPPDVIPENMVYIPEGNFIFGERAFDDQFARTRLPAFLIGKYEVTIKEYLEFWRSLKDPALQEQYKAKIDADIKQGRKLLDLWDSQCRLLAPYTPDMPVVGITPEAVNAYMDYMSKKSGLVYRLPTALQWEKAARGVDGREYVWGNEYKHNYACVSSTRKDDIKTQPVNIGSYPEDCSVYGVMDMTGNVRELVTNPGSWQYYTARGSSFRYSQRFARLPSQAYGSNLSDVGFRCAVELPALKK
ncbi:MAG: SUMF1/EgtB/PvdO family nonheme iron enzyme, partial [Lentisphaeria bacterium]|nr:SUMF1/EgtB/PvdO family nonheme iron enzyme [Lentisphaeria bacterium]